MPVIFRPRVIARAGSDFHAGAGRHLAGPADLAPADQLPKVQDIRQVDRLADVPLTVDFDLGGLPIADRIEGPEGHPARMAHGEAIVHHYVQVLGHRPENGQVRVVGLHESDRSTMGNFPVPYLAPGNHRGIIGEGGRVVGHPDLVPLDVVVFEALLPEVLQDRLGLGHGLDDMAVFDPAQAGVEPDPVDRQVGPEIHDHILPPAAPDSRRRAFVLGESAEIRGLGIAVMRQQEHREVIVDPRGVFTHLDADIAEGVKRHLVLPIVRIPVRDPGQVPTRIDPYRLHGAIAVVEEGIGPGPPGSSGHAHRIDRLTIVAEHHVEASVFVQGHRPGIPLSAQDVL